MIVYVGGKLYNSHDDPILLMLSDEDRQRIADMPKPCNVYAVSSPGGSTRVEMENLAAGMKAELAAYAKKAKCEYCGALARQFKYTTHLCGHPKCEERAYDQYLDAQSERDC